MTLEDGRHIITSDKILGSACNSMNNDPIIFDAVPNFVVSLKDDNLDYVLTYNFKTMNLNFGHEIC